MSTSSFPPAVVVRRRISFALVCLLGFTLPAVSQDQVPREWELPAGLEVGQPQLPDHLQGSMRALNERLSAGLDPAENAAVLLVQLFGEEVFDPPLREDSLAMLGIRSLSSTAPRFQYLDAYTNSRAGQITAAEVNEIHRGLLETSERPWPGAENPALVDFLEANAAALDLLVTAADRPRYYAPLLSEENPPRLLSASPAIDRRLPTMARCLTARAMLRAGEGDFDGAVKDLLACHKLAVLVAQGSPLDLSVAKAHIIDAFASGAEREWVVGGQLTGEQARQLRQALQSLPAIPGDGHAADIGERAIVHQEIELLKTDKDSVEGFLESDKEDVAQQVEFFRNADIHWDLAIKRADEIQDAIVKALSIRDRAEQQTQFQRLDERYMAWQRPPEAGEESFAESFERDPAATSRWIGESQAWALRTNYWQRRHTDDRARNRRTLVDIGLALVIHRREHGTFPTELSELVPAILPEVPLDPHSETPFHYVRLAADHARLTSWGANGVDDAGKIFNDDQILELRTGER